MRLVDTYQIKWYVCREIARIIRVFCWEKHIASDIHHLRL
jgi:hypothetical protein